MRMIPAALVLAIAVSACAEPPAPGKTPEETFGTLVRLVESGERPGIHALFTEEAAADVVARIDGLKANIEKNELPKALKVEVEEFLGMPLEEFVKLPPAEAFAIGYSADETERSAHLRLATLVGAKFVEAVATGETRTRIRFTDADGKPAAAEVILVLEAGVWKLPDSSRILVPAGPSGTGEKERVECLHHLRQLGGLLTVAGAAGGWSTEHGGSGFLLQVRDAVKDEDLGIFLCPGDPATASLLEDPAALAARIRGDIYEAPCGYRGPNRAFLEDPDRPDEYILACCRNGLTGTEPWHDDGVSVLYNTGRVDFIRFEDMEGYEGGPVLVGYGSPDPRFTHLAD